VVHIFQTYVKPYIYQLLDTENVPRKTTINNQYYS